VHAPFLIAPRTRDKETKLLLFRGLDEVSPIGAQKGVESIGKQESHELESLF
jgi:hypothetical protein